MGILKSLSDNRKKESLSTSLRKKRFEIFDDILNKLPKPIKILDVGGSQLFWENIGYLGEEGVEITLMNLFKNEVSSPYFKSIIGDATNMKEIKDKEFDIVFSNSVIEHVYTFENQQKMANEICRTGKAYYVQTPNKKFPIEPHFLFPYFQYLPISIRAKLISNFKLGWYGKKQTYDVALDVVSSIRLMTKRELESVFPNSNIYVEKFYGLEKSFIAWKDI